MLDIRIGATVMMHDVHPEVITLVDISKEGESWVYWRTGHFEIKEAFGADYFDL